MLVKHETLRLRALHEYGILDTPGEQEYHNCIYLASQICQAPVSFISFIDDARQWFKEKIGFDLTQVPRQIALCNHLLEYPEAYLLVNDARTDSRFADNPQVKAGTPVIFCLSVPLKSTSNLTIGTLCVIDHKPREVTDQQVKSLLLLAEVIMEKLERRKQHALKKFIIKDADLMLKAIDASADHLLVIDPYTMKFIGFNKTAAHDLGYTGEELLKMGPQDIKPNYTEKQLQDKFSSIIDTPGSFGTIETVFKKKNGELVDVQAQLTVLTTDDNKQYIIETARDITQQLKVNYELIKNEEKYSNLFNYLPNVMLRTTVSGIIRFITPACFSLLGYTPEELQGKSFVDFYTNKEERKLFTRQLDKLGKALDFQIDLKCKDGSVKTVSVNAQYYRNHKNEVDGIEGVITDITKLVRTTEEINTTKEFFEKTLNSISADIAVYDEENRYCFLNEHAVKDKELRNWLLGKTNYDYCAYRNNTMELADTRQKFLDRMDRAGGKIEWIEELKNNAGETEYILRIMEPFETKDNRKYKVGYGLNITALKNAETNVSQLIASAPNGVILINAMGEMLLWNPANEVIFGWKEEEIIGKNIRELTHPGHRDEFDVFLNEVIQAQSDQHTGMSFDFTALNKEEKWLTIALNISKLIRSGETLFIVFLKDITERKKALEALSKRERQLNEAQEIAGLVSFEWNNNTQKIQWSNTYQIIFNITSHDEINTIDGFLNYVHPGDKQIVAQVIEHFLAWQEVPPLDFRIVTPGGDVKYLTANAIHAGSDPGDEGVVFGTLQDLSDQKLFERKLFKAIIESEEKERHRIAAELHDGVCQDLAAVKLTLGTALRVIDDNIPLARKVLNHSLDTLTNALLLTSKVSHDLLPGDLKEGLAVSFSALVLHLNAVDSIHYSLEIHGDGKEPEPLIAVNLYRITQEFIRNSQKHSGAKNIKITFSFRSDTLQVTLADDGRGFDADKIKSSGIGFINMARRVETIGGNFSLESGRERA